MPENDDLKMRPGMENVLDLRRLVKALLGNIPLILFAGLFVGALLAAKCAYTEKPKYKSSFSIAVSNKAADQEVNSLSTSDFSAASQIASAYAQSIKGNQFFLESVLTSSGLEESLTYPAVKGMVSDAQAAGQQVNITVMSSNAEQCLRIAYAMMDVIPVVMPTLVRGSAVSVISRTDQAFSRTGTDVKGSAKKGILAGLILAAAVVILADILDRRVKSVREIRSIAGGSAVLSVPTAKAGVLFPSEEDRALADSFRSLRTVVKSGVREGCDVLAMTSAERQAGRTSAALNLAAAYGQIGMKCLYIGADLRNPGDSRVFGDTDGAGLCEAVKSQDWKEFITDTGKGFDVLPAGKVPEDPTIVLDSEGMRKLISSARDCYGVVLMDLPPALGCADAMIAARMADAYLFVVRDGQSDIRRIREAAESVRKTGREIRCFVYNDAGVVKV